MLQFTRFHSGQRVEFTVGYTGRGTYFQVVSVILSKRFSIIAITLCAVLVTGEAHAKRRTKTIQYGPHAQHKVKIQFDQTGPPRALNIHFHGGGFTSGRPGFGSLAGQLRGSGMSLAGATYRFIKDGATKLEIQEDGARVVQFLRLHADEYNIDPDRISVSGYSAGGVIAAWVALHDDLADAASSDPVLRESSRVSACWLYKSQVHPLYLADWIRYTSWDTASLASGIVAYANQRLGGDQFAQPFEPSDFTTDAKYAAALEAYQRESFAFYQATADDPPVAFLENGTDDISTYLRKILPQRWGNLLHSPALMIPLQRRLEAVGVDVFWGRKAGVRSFVLEALDQ